MKFILEKEIKKETPPAPEDEVWYDALTTVNELNNLNIKYEDKTDNVRPILEAIIDENAVNAQDTTSLQQRNSLFNFREDLEEKENYNFFNSGMR